MIQRSCAGHAVPMPIVSMEGGEGCIDGGLRGRLAAVKVGANRFAVSRVDARRLGANRLPLAIDPMLCCCVHKSLPREASGTHHRPNNASALPWAIFSLSLWLIERFSRKSRAPVSVRYG